MSIQRRNDQMVSLLQPEFSSSGSAAVTEGPDIDIVVSGANKVIGRGGDTVLLFDSGGNPIAEYAASSAGFDAATAAATAGDIVEVPALTIPDDHSLKAGVHYIGKSRWATIFTGKLTFGIGTTLENCSIVRTANDASTLIGIQAPAAAGVAKVQNVDCDLTQSGSGDAYGVYSSGDGEIKLWNCDLDVTSVSGDGYGTYRELVGASIYLDGGVCIGSTGSCNE